MRRARRLAVLLLVLGAWATVAPYAGPLMGWVVHTQPETEFFTHVVPAVPILAAAVWLWLTGRLPLPLALIAVLCGFWMTGTHLPLLFQAADGGVAWASALWHSIPGLTIFVLTAALATLAWLEERDRERGAGGSK